MLEAFGTPVFSGKFDLIANWAAEVLEPQPVMDATYFDASFFDFGELTIVEQGFSVVAEFTLDGIVPALGTTANDVIQLNAAQNFAVGGVGDDMVNGGLNADVLFGDAEVDVDGLLASLGL